MVTVVAAIFWKVIILCKPEQFWIRHAVVRSTFDVCGTNVGFPIETAVLYFSSIFLFFEVLIELIY